MRHIISYRCKRYNRNFNSRTHVECDGRWLLFTVPGADFNSRTHVECDKTPHNPWGIFEYFNSRTHVECDDRLRAIIAHSVTFQLTHSRGVRLGLVMLDLSGIKNFNSRTHVECDFSFDKLIGYKNNFNSRTHVECDLLVHINSGDLLDFNSRTHVECDEICLAYRARKAISTHALTWSATILRIPDIKSENEFQLTHSRGVRRIQSCKSQRRKHFNSRTHVECDLKYLCIALTPQDFNSRTHVECDAKTEVVEPLLNNFNSRTHVECDHWVD